ncbi:MAG: UV DNA damage repair endonuclease UvsE [Waddliaceae bacterium]
MQRVGLCCLFIEEPICFRTTTARYLSKIEEQGSSRLEYLAPIIESNLQNLYLAIQYCANNGIGAFRINSGLLPIYTHPEWGYTLEDLPNIDCLKTHFQKIKQLSRDRNIRLSFHPDQYVVLNSPKEDVVEKSIADLEYHGYLAKLLGADVINIHGGGGYGDKAAAIQRFAQNFKRLSDEVQKRLTVENDDKTFTPSDLIPLCKELNIPLVYDVHHHRCLPDRLTIEQATKKALETWNREPLFHLSSPKNGWRGLTPRLHHDFIDPQDMPKEWKEIDPLTIDIEAKAKEIAVLRLKNQLIKNGWDLN